MSKSASVRLPRPGWWTSRYQRVLPRWQWLRTARPRHQWRVYAALGLVVVIALTVLAGLVWRLQGGTWAIIETPSMGQAVPVGTLTFTRPAPLSRIEVGDVITYRPSDGPDTMYTHRVVRKYPDLTLQVQGDINGAADPLPVRQDDLVGLVVAQWYAIGWLIRSLPFLIVGAMVIMVATAAFVRPRWRSAVRVMAVSLMFSVSVLILRPFVRPVLIGVSTNDPSAPMANVVSTGLMPTRITGAPDQFVDLVNGQVGSVRVSDVVAGEPFQVSGSPHLDLAWLLLVILGCSLPLVWCLTVGLSPDDEVT